MFLNREVIPITKTDNCATSITTPYEVFSNQPGLQKQRSSFLHNEADHSRLLLDLDGHRYSIEYYDVPNFGMESFKNVLVSVIQSYTTIKTTVFCRKKYPGLIRKFSKQ